MASQIIPADFYLKHIERLNRSERKAWRKETAKSDSESIRTVKNISAENLRELKQKARRQAWRNAGLLVLLTTGTILGCQYFANVAKIVENTFHFEPLTPILTNAVETIGKASNYVVQGAKNLASMAGINMPAPDVGRMLTNVAAPFTKIADVTLNEVAWKSADLAHSIANKVNTTPGVPLALGGALAFGLDVYAAKKSFGKLQDGRQIVKATKTGLKTR